MKRWNRYLAIAFVLLIGAWGCSRGSTGITALNDRIQSLEAKTIRLEEDFRTSSAQRDQFRKRLIAEEELRGQLQLEVERLQTVVKDLNEVKSQLAQRTSEKEQLQYQFDGFRKNLREMLGQADSAANAFKQSVPAVQTSQQQRIVPTPIAPGRIEEKSKTGL